MHLLVDILVLFSLAVLVLLVVHRLRVPPMVGFLLTGLVAGPHGLGLVSDVHEVEVMAEVGVVLLLFTVGLDLSLSELMRLGRPFLVGGGLQVLGTTLLFGAVSLAVGLKLGPSVFVGWLVALSSTAIVLQLLQARVESNSPHGRFSLSVLLFQDLVVVLMMLATPLLAGGGAEGTLSPQEVLVGLAVVTLVFVVGRKAIPAILHLVLRTRSRELMLLTTLALCLGIALLTARVGLSLALGAFLAGLLVSESRYSLSALQGVMPFRDVFTSLFFVSVGMLLDARFVMEHPVAVLGVAAGVVAGKSLVAGAAVAVLGFPLRTAILAGLGLAQVGEFSFILARSGVSAGLLEGDRYQLFLAASVVTMALTPLLVHVAPRLADRLTGALHRAPRGPAPEAASPEREGHLVIVGFGMGGRYLARVARNIGIPYVILETNPETVRREAEKGEPIVHGDAALAVVQEHVGVPRARALVVVVSDPAGTRQIAAVARQVNPSIHVVVRTRFYSEVEPLRALGADDVVSEEYETAIEVFTRVLAHFLVPTEQISRFTEEVRAEGYAVFRQPAVPPRSLHALSQHLTDYDMAAATLQEGCPACGRTLAELDFRRVSGFSVIAVRRGDQTWANPGGEFRLQSGDVIYVFGPQADLGAGIRHLSGCDGGGVGCDELGGAVGPAPPEA